MTRKRLTRLVGVCVVLATLTACGPGAQGEEVRPVIAGGYPSGVYYSYAERLGESLEAELSIPVEVVESHGSVDNLMRVGAQTATLGFAQGDTAADAVLGEGRFEDPLPIQAVARVYDEYVHVVVPAASQVDAISDLAGKTVSLGAEASGVQVIAERVLAASGVAPSQVTNPALGLEASIEALEAGRIDAFFWVGGVPTPGIEQLQERFAIRFLSIDAEVVQQVNVGHSGVYQFADFPVEIYEISRPAMTMIVPNYLVTHEATSEKFIADTLTVLFQTRSEMARDVPAVNFLDRRRAIFTGPMELHPGAVDYFASQRR